MRPGEPAAGAQLRPVTVPAGSTLVVRATGDVGLDVAVSGGIARGESATRQPQAPKGTEERRFTISAAGTATVRGGGDDVVWAFNAIPDRPPTIALAKEPEAQLRGSLLLNYKIEDDYGVVDAQATFERKPVPARRRGQAAAPAVRCARLYAGAAAGAHPERRRPDHQGSDRASLGRRRRDDDARRPRRGQQRRPLDAARTAAAGAAVRQAACRAR